MKIFKPSKTKKVYNLEQSFFDDLNSIILQNQFIAHSNNTGDFFEKFVPSKIEVIEIFDKVGNRTKLKETHYILYTFHQNQIYKFDYYYEHYGFYSSMGGFAQKKEKFLCFSFYKRVRLEESRKLYPNGYLAAFNYLNDKLGIFTHKNNRPVIITKI